MSRIVAIFRVPDMSPDQYDNVMADLDRTGMYKVRARSHHVMAPVPEIYPVHNVVL